MRGLIGAVHRRRRLQCVENGSEYDHRGHICDPELQMVSTSVSCFRTVLCILIERGAVLTCSRSCNRFIYLGQSFNYPSKTLSLTTKVVVNQLVFAPLFNSYFFGMQALLSGDDLRQTWEHVKRTVPTSLVNSCKLWPAVTAFSFTFVQAQYRALFAGVVAIGWQTYLSFLNQLALQRGVLDTSPPRSSQEGVGRTELVRPSSNGLQAEA